MPTNQPINSMINDKPRLQQVSSHTLECAHYLHQLIPLLMRRQKMALELLQNVHQWDEYSVKAAMANIDHDNHKIKQILGL